MNLLIFEQSWLDTTEKIKKEINEPTDLKCILTKLVVNEITKSLLVRTSKLSIKTI